MSDLGFDATFIAPQDGSPGYLQPKGKETTGTVAHDHDYEDVKASAAVRGIPQSTGADALEFLENEYEKWMNDPEKITELIQPRLGVWASIKATYQGRVEISRKNIFDLAAEPFRICRLQIRELALALATELNDKRALLAQADIGAAHIKHQQEMAEFRKFLMQHFEPQLDLGAVRNQSLLDIAKGIMLEQKQKI
jgi:hypothetical protein